MAEMDVIFPFFSTIGRPFRQQNRADFYCALKFEHSSMFSEVGTTESNQGNIRKCGEKSNQEPQTSVTVQKSAAKEADTGGINNHDSSDDEVTFGPADAAENDDLDKTVEDEVDEGLGKKGKNKKKKKKNKKKKAKQEDEVAFGEPAEKKQKI